MVLYGIPYYFLCCIVCVPWHCLYGMVLRGMKWTSLQSRKHHSCWSLSALCRWWGCLSQESIHAPSSPSMGKTFLFLPFQPSCQFPNLTIWYQPRQYQHRCRSAWCRPMQEKSRPDPYGQSGKAAQRDSKRRDFFTWSSWSVATSPEWLLWKVSSQGGLEPATETQRKQPIPPTASGGRQEWREWWGWFCWWSMINIMSIMVHVKDARTSNNSTQQRLCDNKYQGKHLAKRLFDLSNKTVSPSSRKAHIPKCQHVLSLWLRKMESRHFLFLA